MHEGHHGILDGVKKDAQHKHAHPHVHSHDGGAPHSHSDDAAGHGHSHDATEQGHEHADHAAGTTQSRNRWLAIGVVVVLFGALYLLISGR